MCLCLPIQTRIEGLVQDHVPGLHVMPTRIPGLLITPAVCSSSIRWLLLCSSLWLVTVPLVLRLV
jgi:hypothetical protein